MNVSPQKIAESYRACRGVSRRAKSTFRVSFLFLPPAKRRAMEALYAFMRHSDDLVDDPRGDCSPQAALLGWREALQHALDGRFETASNLADHRNGQALLPALADTVQRFHIPAEHLWAVLDGMEMDLRPRAYATFAQLQTYCERVASAVGLACIHIWGFAGPSALECARSAGIALQLTNILRDVREDARAGRIYLPLEDLAACRYSVEELRQGTVNANFYRLMELEAQRAEGFYRAATGLLECLAPDGRRIFATMMATYHALLRRIARRPADVFARHVRVGWPQRLWITARGTLGNPRRLLTS